MENFELNMTGEFPKVNENNDLGRNSMFASVLMKRKTQRGNE